MKMWPKCTLMTQTIEAEALQKSYFKNSIIFKCKGNFQVPDICELWTLIITAEIATPGVTQLLASNCCLFFPKLSLNGRVWACWVVHRSANPGAQLWDGVDTCVLVWSGTPEKGQEAFTRKGRAAVWKVREDWVLCIHQTPLMRAVSRVGGTRRSSGDGAGAIPAESDLKEGAAVGRIDPRLTWSASKQQIITSGLLSSPVASWDHQAGFFGWLASALSRPTYSFTNNISMWLGTQAWKVQSLSSVLSPRGTESQALIGSVRCLFRRVGY